MMLRTPSLLPLLTTRVRSPQHLLQWIQVGILNWFLMYEKVFFDKLKDIYLYAFVFLPVPCVPQNAGATQNCDTEEVTITWDNAVFPDSYTATITGGASPVMCTSAQSPCIQSGLPCGTSYDVVVASEHTGCFSTDSEPITVETREVFFFSKTVITAVGFIHISLKW